MTRYLSCIHTCHTQAFNKATVCKYIYFLFFINLEDADFWAYQLIILSSPSGPRFQIAEFWLECSIVELHGIAQFGMEKVIFHGKERISFYWVQNFHFWVQNLHLLNVEFPFWGLDFWRVCLRCRIKSIFQSIFQFVLVQTQKRHTKHLCQRLASSLWKYVCTFLQKIRFEEYNIRFNLRMPSLNKKRNNYSFKRYVFKISWKIIHNTVHQKNVDLMKESL